MCQLEKIWTFDSYRQDRARLSSQWQKERPQWEIRRQKWGKDPPACLQHIQLTSESLWQQADGQRPVFLSAICFLFTRWWWDSVPNGAVRLAAEVWREDLLRQAFSRLAAYRQNRHRHWWERNGERKKTCPLLHSVIIYWRHSSDTSNAMVLKLEQFPHLCAVLLMALNPCEDTSQHVPWQKEIGTKPHLSSWQGIFKTGLFRSTRPLQDFNDSV